DQQSHTSMRVAYIVISLHLDAALISSPCTLSLHAALPICVVDQQVQAYLRRQEAVVQHPAGGGHGHEQGHGHRQRQQARLAQPRSEEHTSELQSRENLVCRLLLEKKKDQF